MSFDERRGDLDRLLSRAVDRQVAEQRALREALAELRVAVTEMRAPPPDSHQFAEQLRGAVRAVARVVTEEIGRLRDEILRPLAEVETSLAELRERVEGGAEGVGNPATPEGGVGVLPAAMREEEILEAVRGIRELREDVGGVAADVVGIARALVDLNAGLRAWAESVEGSVASLQDSVERVERSVGEPAGLLEGSGGGADLAPARRRRPTPGGGGEISPRPGGLDSVAAELREVPKAIDAALTQALRRALAARAKLDREAESALEEVLGALDERLDDLGEVLSRLGGQDEQVRKIALGQVELVSRIESLHETVLDRLDRLAEVVGGRAPAPPQAKTPPRGRTAKLKAVPADAPPPARGRRRGGEEDGGPDLPPVRPARRARRGD